MNKTDARGEAKVMEAQAISRYVRVSPTKVRPYADAVRRKHVAYAVVQLKLNRLKKNVGLMKTILSAYHNLKMKAEAEGKQIDENTLVIKEVSVDNGPFWKYYKPAAMGRASPQRKRTSHIKVVVSAVVR